MCCFFLIMMVNDYFIATWRHAEEMEKGVMSISGDREESGCPLFESDQILTY